MCGRFAQRKPIQDILERFNILDPEEVLFEPRYNIAPTQYSPVVIIENDQRILRLMKWGLVPFWSKDSKTGYKMINARSETLAQKTSFKRLLPSRRCLIVTDGFYEWAKLAKGKAPMRFLLKGGEPFAFAGLWDRWKKPDGNELRTYTIITTQANELLKPVHDRMPVILNREAEEKWLDPEWKDSQKLGELLKPFAADQMESYYVSPMVNSPKNDLIQCIQPVDGP